MVPVLGDVLVEARVALREDDLVLPELADRRALLLLGRAALLVGLGQRLERLPLLQRRRLVAVLRPVLADLLAEVLGQRREQRRPAVRVRQQLLAVLADDVLDEDGLEEAESTFEGRVERRLELRLLCRVLVARDDGEVLDDGEARVVGELAARGVGDPAVDAAAARVDPHDVLEAEVVAERGVDDFDGRVHVVPALAADARALAAGPDVVVVGKVNVEDELALLGPEVLDRQMVARRRVEDRPDVDLVRLALRHQRLHARRVREALVPDVHVVRERQRQLAPVHDGARSRRALAVAVRLVREPPAHGLVRE
mmetsp:Transcript_25492/g.78556  ORF Transcript_25492/g.78556 Transcript_25492/m.78556 type:complete len:312 (-) Transcript_25492:249-1184(-)